MFWCISAYFQTTRIFFQKRYFLPCGVVKNVFWCIFAYFHTTRKFFFRKDICYCLEWLKTCFDTFAQSSRPSETFCQKWYFLLSWVVKSVFWCICTYFQNTRNFFSKEIFFTVWSGYKRVLMHFRILPYHQKPFLEKIFFTVWSG